MTLFWGVGVGGCRCWSVLPGVGFKLSGEMVHLRKAKQGETMYNRIWVGMYIRGHGMDDRYEVRGTRWMVVVVVSWMGPVWGALSPPFTAKEPENFLGNCRWHHRVV